MNAYLTIIEGKEEGRRLPLDGRYLLIGRSGDADINLKDDAAISRRHLEIRRADGAVFVKNLSPTGSLINGKRLEKDSEVSLNPGDELIIGHTKLVYDE